MRCYSLDDIHSLAREIDIHRDRATAWRDYSIRGDKRLWEVHDRLHALQGADRELIHEMALDINHFRDCYLDAEDEADEWMDACVEAEDAAAYLATDKNELIQALAPWWDSDATGGDDGPDDRLIMALPEWVVKRMDE